ncbi:TPA: hypothetical protein KOY26_001505 [Clostridioides difficile]|nr:hypothetical protein [Clostridioides difficile]
MKYEEYKVALKRIKEFEEITKYKQITDEVLEKLDSNSLMLKIKPLPMTKNSNKESPKLNLFKKIKKKKSVEK